MTPSDTRGDRFCAIQVLNGSVMPPPYAQREPSLVYMKGALGLSSILAE
jgi:hypothetical protein